MFVPNFKAENEPTLAIQAKKGFELFKKLLAPLKLLLYSVVWLVLTTGVFGQAAQQTANGKDQTLRGSGRVNPSTLGMEFELPLGSYPGRGINVPISLSYSSKLWRMDYVESFPAVNNPNTCHSEHNAVFSEDSASGWTTSLATPYIEYLGAKALLDGSGHPYSDGGCNSSGVPENPGRYYIKKVVIHLPSGETHELRADDVVRSFPLNGNIVGLFEGVFYAVDGSNIKYSENTNAGTYSVQMPDGSRYDLAGSLAGQTRQAIKFTDRNGNFTTYNESNGTWTDTLGRTIAQPFGLAAPTTPTVQTYTLPGMAGNYKFYWKKLKDTTPAESGLGNFNLALKYPADNANFAPRAAGTYLFQSDTTPVNKRYVSDNGQLFNPLVLTAIELPTGQKYEFRYSVFGIIEEIKYPTGGAETFLQAWGLESLSGANDFFYSQTNSGVIERKVYETSGQGTPYRWNYNIGFVAPNGYKVIINNPDGTIQERFLHRGNPSCTGLCPGNNGYDNGLAGYAYEERGYNSAGQIVSKTLTSWTKTATPIPNTNYTMDIHPRVNQAESIIFDGSGNGVSATTKYEYEGDLNLRETPVLVNKTLQYAFVPLPGGANNVPPPGGDPDDDPTPVPTPIPPTLLRTQETTYLINDPNYQSTKSYYINQNMIGLATVSVVKDGAETIVSRSEMVYDETNYSPPYRGNPTSSRVWDSTKGLVTNSSAYLQTRAKFDGYGNQYQSIDAKGNTTITEYDATYQAFPIKVTTPVPDTNGTNSSNQPFVTEATFNYTTGLPLTTKDANGQITTIEYDALTLRPKKVTPPTGTGTAETFYNDAPNNYWVKNKTQIDTNKWAESITYYDGLGRAFKSEQIDSQGNIFVEKEFDAQGRVKRVTNPFRANETKIWTTNVYDEASRIKEVVLPDNSKVITDYEVSVTEVIGITKQITDQAGKKRKGISDVLGRMVRVIEDPTGQNLSTDYVFDTLGNLRKTVQGEQSRYFNYDSLGRLLYAKQPEQEVNTAFVTTDLITSNTQWSVKYVYDDNGNITTTTDARGVSVTGTYDNFNRLKLRDYSDTTPDVSFYYDGTGLGSVPAYSKGKTTKVTSSVSESRYTSFDNLGRTLSSQQITDGQTYNFGYQYNMSGLIAETYPSGRIVRQEFDVDGDLLRVSGNAAGQTEKTYANSFNYNSAGAITSLRLGNGKWETAKYNNRLQVTEIGLGSSATNTGLLKLSYDYGTATENNGSMKTQTMVVPNVGANNGFTATQTYNYDSLNRIQSATETVSGSQTWKQTFTYDRYGNRRFDAINTTTLGSCSQVVCNPDISTATNRLVGYSFDKTGNVTTDAESRQFFYDAENHQKEVKNSNGLSLGQYFYDGEGRRVKKVNPQTLETTVFVYDGAGQLAAEYSTQTVETPQTSYLTQDHLGSPRIITNQLGAVTSRKDFAAFGDETITAQRTQGLGYQPDSIRQDYTSYQKDDESGLEFAQARYYNSTHGRFTSVDPLTASANVRDPQTFNRYSYALNSPYKFTDPLGLVAQSSFGSSGVCSAENASCDGGDNRAQGEAEYEQRLKNDRDRMRAQEAANRGDKDTLWNIIRDNSTLEAQDANGNVIQDPNNPTVTVEATVNPPSENAAPVVVIIWDGVNAFTTSYFGHVSYVVYGDESLSWEGGYKYLRETASEYEKRRSKTSAGVAYTIDFGIITIGKRTVDLNQVFTNGLESFQNGKRGYGPLSNNCGHACSYAIERVRQYLNIAINTSTLPSGHKAYIERSLKKYVTK